MTLDAFGGRGSLVWGPTAAAVRGFRICPHGGLQGCTASLSGQGCNASLSLSLAVGFALLLFLSSSASEGDP